MLPVETFLPGIDTITFLKWMGQPFCINQLKNPICPKILIIVGNTSNIFEEGRENKEKSITFPFSFLCYQLCLSCLPSLLLRLIWCHHFDHNVKYRFCQSFMDKSGKWMVGKKLFGKSITCFLLTSLVPVDLNLAEFFDYC